MLNYVFWSNELFLCHDLWEHKGFGHCSGCTENIISVCDLAPVSYPIGWVDLRILAWSMGLLNLNIWSLGGQILDIQPLNFFNTLISLSFHHVGSLFNILGPRSTRHLRIELEFLVLAIAKPLGWRGGCFVSLVNLRDALLHVDVRELFDEW